MPDPDVPARPVAPASLLERIQDWRRDPRLAVSVVLVVAIAAFVVWARAGDSGGNATPPTGGSLPPAAAPETTTAPRALVHVVGAVRAPGVVELVAGARVRDALAAAGGPTDDADIERLNLAAPVSDGERLAVPHLGEPAPLPVVNGPGGPDGPSGASPGPLDLNVATATDLETLPGIGPTLAEAIVREREKRGRFGSVEDLKQVRGIGEGRFAEIRDLVRV
ncbi:MAG: helix-hairpin-helix domain-containing protein [Acidimicrobiia bacterium]